MPSLDASAMPQPLDAPSPLVTIRYTRFYPPCLPDKATTCFSWSIFSASLLALRVQLASSSRVGYHRPPCKEVAMRALRWWVVSLVIVLPCVVRGQQILQNGFEGRATQWKAGSTDAALK